MKLKVMVLMILFFKSEWCYSANDTEGSFGLKWSSNVFILSFILNLILESNIFFESDIIYSESWLITLNIEFVMIKDWSSSNYLYILKKLIVILMVEG